MIWGRAAEQNQNRIQREACTFFGSLFYEAVRSKRKLEY